MKTKIVGVGVGFILLTTAVSAAAQVTETITVTPPTEQNRVPGCRRPDTVSIEVWNEMLMVEQRSACGMNASTTSADNAIFWRDFCEQNKYAPGIWETPSCVAQLGPKPEIVSRKLGIAGVVTALAGVAMLGPWGNSVTVVDTTYCVTDRYDVYEGGCNARGTQAALGAALLGGGILMTWAGMRHKKVKKAVISPILGPTAVGASITW